MSVMKETSPAIPPGVMAEIEQALDGAIRGVHDPEAMAKAAERMDHMRMEMRQRVGDVDLAVPLIRESRDEE